MLSFLITLTTGALAGLVVAYVPYGGFISVFFGILTAVFALRLAISKPFRNSPAGSRQFNFIIGFWIVVGIFHVRPTGLDAMLPEMDVENVEVSSLVEEWTDLTTNIEFRCMEDACDKKLELHTITPISVMEVMEAVEDQTGARVEFTVDRKHGTIADGPRIIVGIFPGDEDTPQ